MLLQTIKKNLTMAMKNGNIAEKDALRMVLSEVPRLNLKAGKEATDEQIQQIIRKLIKSETMVLEYSGQDESKSEYINILREYLPKMMSHEDVCIWLAENRNIIDLDKFRPQIKAMGPIMKHLKGKVDGNIVRKILEWNDAHEVSG